MRWLKFDGKEGKDKKGSLVELACSDGRLNSDRVTPNRSRLTECWSRTGQSEYVHDVNVPVC